MQVLLYDPDGSSRKILIKVLKNLGLSWIPISSPRAIKSEIKKKNYDILILDSTRQKSLGQLQKIYHDVPIILIADSNTTVDYEKIMFSGVSGVITRPYRVDFLKKTITKAVKKRREIITNQNTMFSLTQKIQELQILNEVVQAINSSLRLDEILQIIMEKAADLIRAEGWSVLLLDNETNELVFKAASGKAGKKLLGMRLRIGQGVAGWVALHGESLIIPDVTQDPRFYSGVDEKTKFITKSILCVPMRSRDKIIGVVEVVNKIGGEPFTQDDFEIFKNLVAHLTIALEKATIYRRMEEASLIDDLTKLYNTRYCNQFLDNFLKERKDSHGIISLIFLDIDFFKLVDDNYGHLVGSETLKVVGDRMHRVVRKNDIIVRYGGDEYIVILPNTDKKTASIIAERIRKEICREPFYAFGSKRFNISVTLGVATYPEDAKNRDELIGKADKAMYQGKLSGRNKTVLA